MIKRVNNCVDCHTEMGCMGTICSYLENIELVCDKCNNAVDELYEVDNAELCEDCLKQEFKKITYDNIGDIY